MQHRRGIFLNLDGLVLAVGYLGVGLDDVMFGIDGVEELDLVLVDRVDKGYHGLLGAVGQTVCLMAGIVEQGRGVAVGMVDVERGLVVVLHAVGYDGLRPIGYLRVVGTVLEFLAEIALV